MNTTRISVAIRRIERNTAALKWLEEYGPRLRGSDKDSIGIVIRPHFAGSCAGSKEAAEVLETWARLSIMELVEKATENCRNTIEIHRQTIIDEVGRALEEQRSENSTS